jgi:hypothetical protein
MIEKRNADFGNPFRDPNLDEDEWRAMLDEDGDDCNSDDNPNLDNDNNNLDGYEDDDNTRGPVDKFHILDAKQIKEAIIEEIQEWDGVTTPRSDKDDFVDYIRNIYTAPGVGGAYTFPPVDARFEFTKDGLEALGSLKQEIVDVAIECKGLNARLLSLWNILSPETDTLVDRTNEPLGSGKWLLLSTCAELQYMRVTHADLLEGMTHGVWPHDNIMSFFSTQLRNILTLKQENSLKVVSTGQKEPNNAVSSNPETPNTVAPNTIAPFAASVTLKQLLPTTDTFPVTVLDGAADHQLSLHRSKVRAITKAQTDNDGNVVIVSPRNHNNLHWWCYAAVIKRADGNVNDGQHIEQMTILHMDNMDSNGFAKRSHTALDYELPEFFRLHTGESSRVIVPVPVQTDGWACSHLTRVSMLCVARGGSLSDINPTVSTNVNVVQSLIALFFLDSNRTAPSMLRLFAADNQRAPTPTVTSWLTYQCEKVLPPTVSNKPHLRTNADMIESSDPSSSSTTASTDEEHTSSVHQSQTHHPRKQTQSVKVPFKDVIVDTWGCNREDIPSASRARSMLSAYFALEQEEGQRLQPNTFVNTETRAQQAKPVKWALEYMKTLPCTLRAAFKSIFQTAHMFKSLVCLAANKEVENAATVDTIRAILKSNKLSFSEDSRGSYDVLRSGTGNDFDSHLATIKRWEEARNVNMVNDVTWGIDESVQTKDPWQYPGCDASDPVNIALLLIYKEVASEVNSKAPQSSFAKALDSQDASDTISLDSINALANTNVHTHIFLAPDGPKMDMTGGVITYDATSDTLDISLCSRHRNLLDPDTQEPKTIENFPAVCRQILDAFTLDSIDSGDRKTHRQIIGDCTQVKLHVYPAPEPKDTIDGSYWTVMFILRMLFTPEQLNPTPEQLNSTNISKTCTWPAWNDLRLASAMMDILLDCGIGDQVLGRSATIRRRFSCTLRGRDFVTMRRCCQAVMTTLGCLREDSSTTQLPFYTQHVLLDDIRIGDSIQTVHWLSNLKIQWSDMLNPNHTDDNRSESNDEQATDPLNGGIKDEGTLVRSGIAIAKTLLSKLQAKSHLAGVLTPKMTWPSPAVRPISDDAAAYVVHSDTAEEDPIVVLDSVKYSAKATPVPVPNHVKPTSTMPNPKPSPTATGATIDTLDNAATKPRRQRRQPPRRLDTSSTSTDGRSSERAYPLRSRNPKDTSSTSTDGQPTQRMTTTHRRRHNNNERNS